MTIRAATIILATCGLLALCSCDRNSHREETLQNRIHELEVELAANRDSIKHYWQLGWCFSQLSSVVRTNGRQILLGDSIGVEVHLAAGNDDHSFYPVHPILQLEDRYKDVALHQAGSIGWMFHLKPDKIGRDSISGALLVPNQGDVRDTIKLPFVTNYTVVLPQDAPFSIDR